ncbi:uncharacterized protein BO66DRAFT_178839 [Aspergillus aculeatinus CBS 121060]|uniref:Uncharacterized protein n=1 Tax=Aspergillus aculeatinus CBS 121060 TaxID=1448322 RepID=A0ACD1HKR1_9EURO|nr:hypothetical protein BO66DRAFT_178839 [Aspergillus aculeatinus CBS 121060]RAH74026.1 hypothetical protein BO66DRAFT_178839 [Aspergillus aculeatinus CBS 121060]
MPSFWLEVRFGRRVGGSGLAGEGMNLPAWLITILLLSFCDVDIICWVFIAVVLTMSGCRPIRFLNKSRCS